MPKKISSGLFVEFISKNSLAYWILIFISFFVFAGSGYFSDQFIQDQHQREAQSAFDKSIFILKEEFNSIQHGLQGLAGIYTVLEFTPSESQIRKYAQSRGYYYNFPSVLGFGFIRKVKTHELNQYEINTKKRISNFSIKHIDRQYLNENEQMIIENIEPIEVNKAALGLNVGSEKNRREALLRANKNQSIVITTPIELVQLAEKKVGFLVYHPVFNSSSNLVGWSYAPILMSKFFTIFLSKIDSKLDYQIEIKLDNGEFRLLEKTEKFEPIQTSGHRHWLSQNLELAGREWRLTGLLKEFYGFDLVTLFIGFIHLSLFLLWVYFIYRLKVLHLAAIRSRDLYLNAEQWSKTILNNTTYSVISTKVDGVITTFNDAAVKMLGYSAEEMIDKQTPAIIHDLQEVVARASVLSKELGFPVEPGFDAFIAKAKIHGQDINEWTYVRKDGTRFPVRLCVTAIYDTQKKLIGYLGLAEDITEVKDVQLKMIHSSKMSTLGEMAGGIAHEINNPLSIILGRADMIGQLVVKENEDRSKIVQEVNKIKDTISRITKIISGLRAFARTSEHSPMEKIQVSKLVEDTLDLCNERFKNAGIDLIVDCKTESMIQCRPTQISQVLINLLSNAFDAVKDVESKWVKIKCINKDHSVVFMVSDSGKGIPEDIRSKIMQPFFTTKPVGKGTGLGLSISKGIIEEHEGSITLNNQSSHTEFIVEIPQAS